MAKKRANNGMGSIRQRSDGRWEGRYTAPDGRQRSVYARTEKEVTARLRGALHEVDSGAWREPSNMTVSEWMDIWLKDYQGHTTERSVTKYRSITERHIKPVIGDVKVSKLLPLHARRVMSSISGLAPYTIRTYMAVFRSALSCAVEAGIIKSSPAANIKTPRVPPQSFHVIDRETIPAFIAAAQETHYPNELVFMLLTGLRVGEVRGLRWSDVDMDAQTVNVQRQLHPKSLSKERFSLPKYNEARMIHLPDEAVEILRAQKRRQAEQHIAAANWIDDDISTGLVFRQRNGLPHGEKTIFTSVQRAGAAIGMPDLHPHDLRHSYAVAALRSGADVKTVQHNLGHKTAKMTLDTYAAYTDDAGIEGAKKLSNYIKNAAK